MNPHLCMGLFLGGLVYPLIDTRIKAEKLGVVGASAIFVAGLPQAVNIIIYRNIDGISLPMYCLLVFGMSQFLYYAFKIDNKIMIVQNIGNLFMYGGILFMIYFIKIGWMSPAPLHISMGWIPKLDLVSAFFSL